MILYIKSNVVCVLITKKSTCVFLICVGGMFDL